MMMSSAAADADDGYPYVTLDVCDCQGRGLFFFPSKNAFFSLKHLQNME
jgi:hypothetical protein